MRGRLGELMPEVLSRAAGEEATAAEWQVFLSMPAGTVGAILDPLDGTMNQRAIREAFSCQIGIYRALGGGTFEFLGAAGTSSTMETMFFALDAREAWMVSPTGRNIRLPDGLTGPRATAAGSLAVLGSRDVSRKKLEDLLDPDGGFALPSYEYGGGSRKDPGLNVFLTGGAPKMISWPLSELEYLLVPEDLAPYDAFMIVGALMAGGSAYYRADTGSWVSLETVVDWLSVVTGPEGEDPTPFKAGLLVRDGAQEATTSEILTRLRSH